jgi:hypothetical protein
VVNVLVVGQVAVIARVAEIARDARAVAINQLLPCLVNQVRLQAAPIVQADQAIALGAVTGPRDQEIVRVGQAAEIALVAEIARDGRAVAINQLRPCRVDQGNYPVASIVQAALVVGIVRGGPAMVSGRIDRVFVPGSLVIVIDGKGGETIIAITSAIGGATIGMTTTIGTAMNGGFAIDFATFTM